VKWYKHISDSLDDPFIFELIDQFGGDGYLVFFGTLEIMSREFNIELPGKCTVPYRFLTKKLQLSRQKVSKILKFCNEKERIFVTENKDNIDLNCPKLKKLCDEWTTRQLRSESRVEPEKLKPKEVEVETEVEVDSKELPSADLQNKKSKHFKDQITDDDYLVRLNEMGEKLTELKSDFNWWQMIQRYFNEKRHPDAIIDVLGIIKDYIVTGTLKNTPWGLANKLMPIKSQNYNEQDTRQAHEAIKNQIEADPEIKEMAAKIFKPIPGKRKLNQGQVGRAKSM